MIEDKLKQYLPYFSQTDHILDIGCGRGEFIELLQQEGKQGTVSGNLRWHGTYRDYASVSGRIFMSNIGWTFLAGLLWFLQLSQN